MKKIIAVAGPTAIGKTALAIDIAQRLDGEIISCDSMQIYKKMNIGTAKPTADELMLVPHHMIDIVQPDENYSCADYTRDARKCIEDILGREKTPIFCGGTGLYLESVLYQNDFMSPQADIQLREKLLNESAEQNYAELVRIDPESAEKIHPNNRKRVIRALEIYYESGITKTEWDKKSRSGESLYNADIYALVCSDRQYLYSRIDARVDRMMEEGLLDEVRSLNLPDTCTASQAIGYKELIAYLNGEETLEEAVSLIKQATRNYAKRQITWWERNKNAIKIDIGHGDRIHEISDYICNKSE